MNQSLRAAVSLSMVACLSGVAQAQAAGEPAGNASHGQRKAAMCMGCHGIEGYRASFPEVHRVPMIAGQSAPYLAAALQAYRDGTRRHPTMRAIAGSLSARDMADLAAYYAAQGLPARGGSDMAPAASAGAAQPAPAVASLLVKGNCATCHGAGFNQPIDASFPKIAGQHPDYLYVALKAYRTDKHAQVGREHAVMSAQAKPFSNTELQRLAQYIGALPGDLQTAGNARLR